MDLNSQSRKYFLTIMNAEKHGYTFDKVIAILSSLSLAYFCASEEVAKTGTPHIHIYLYSPSPIRFKTLKNLFNNAAHIERARGSSIQNRDYIAKEGDKWATDEKANTKIQGSFYESKELPPENEPKLDKKTRLLELIKTGMSTREIIETDPSYIYNKKIIDEVRQMVKEEEYLKCNRELHVSYVWGPTGVGKTYDIQKEFGPENICRITSYKKDGTGMYFDSYSGQDIIVIEEFDSKYVPIELMLNLLDVYPIYLPARYYDRLACFHRVFITSNVPLSEQYCFEQLAKKQTWEAFLRRIDTVIEYTGRGIRIETEPKEGFGNPKRGERIKN